MIVVEVGCSFDHDRLPVAEGEEALRGRSSLDWRTTPPPVVVTTVRTRAAVAPRWLRGASARALRWAGAPSSLLGGWLGTARGIGRRALAQSRCGEPSAHPRDQIVSTCRPLARPGFPARAPRAVGTPPQQLSRSRPLVADIRRRGPSDERPAAGMPGIHVAAAIELLPLSMRRAADNETRPLDLDRCSVVGCSSPTSTRDLTGPSVGERHAVQRGLQAQRDLRSRGRRVARRQGAAAGAWEPRLSSTPSWPSW